jgi:hypothetical protein
MLRPPSEYEAAKVSLSSRAAKIDNLFFDSAIIFFVPKVADKGVDLASLVCTIVQITDRGEWGKEEESFTVDASSLNNRKYRQFDLTTDAEYCLRIVPPPELRMGVLEIYFDPTTSNKSAMATLNNPSSTTVDMTAVTAAITAGSTAQIAATQALQAATSKQVKQIQESVYTANIWSNVPGNHIALPKDPLRMGVTLLNTSNKPVYYDLFIDINTKSTVPQYDNVMAPGGSVTLGNDESVTGLMLYCIGGTGTATVAVNQAY